MAFIHSRKDALHGAGVVAGTVQAISVASGTALDLTAWAGLRVAVHATGQFRYRWSQSSTPTTIDATTNATNASSPVATGGGIFYSTEQNVRDVPQCQPGESVFLIVVPVTGTPSIFVEVLS